MKEEKKIEKTNRRAMREGLQGVIYSALVRKFGSHSPKKLKAMAKQMSQGKHPAMGINF
jgi:hypothetical protein